MTLKNIRPGGRLAEIISRVPLGVRVLDVGTDHGYVPIALVRLGFSMVYASDIAKKPLEIAKSNAVRQNAAANIRFILADGIPDELRGKIDCVIIAGMGGETIADIVARAGWLRCDNVTLVLQPQTKVSILTDFLLANEYRIPKMATVAESGRVYTVITATTEVK